MADMHKLAIDALRLIAMGAEAPANLAANALSLIVVSSVEARFWADDLDPEDDMMPFAETRNAEVIAPEVSNSRPDREGAL